MTEPSEHESGGSSPPSVVPALGPETASVLQAMVVEPRDLAGAQAWEVSGQPLSELAAERPVPDRIADFEIVRRLGIGGMAEVFLARKRGAEGTYKLLVLKRILPDYVSSRRFRVMFAEEAQLATRLNHPNIVQVYEFQDYGDEGQLLSMEYVDGPDLRAFTKALRAQEGRLPPPLAAYIAAEVAKGLHYAHERTDESGAPLDIVHRDVSPQNILLSRDGAVKIADFGIATANLFREEPGVLKGKTGYMAPEQARGQKVDRRTDIYSLGVVLHELLTGRPLHGSLEGDALLNAVRTGGVEPPSHYALNIPPSLDAIALQALAPEAAGRFETARDFALALTRALFEMGELVDAHTLEGELVRFLGAPKAETDENSQRSRDAFRTDSSGDSSEGTPVEPLLLSREQGREVRHVAVVSIAIDGQEELSERLGEHGARAALDRIASTLDAIAFKRNMQLSWERQQGLVVRGRGIAGLLAHPTTAAADALWFVVDAREGISAARADLEVELSARVGVVRSIATGRRDKNGNLFEHELAETSLALADLLRDRASQGSSLVAGGLYRLVRRDFFWGDAPNIEISPTLALNLPPQLRVYSLLRGLTREEKLHEVAHAPTELIGRDAEMADLHAAYYSAVGQRPAGARPIVRVVSGELGIGKTALVYAFLNELPPDAHVLRAECSQGRRDVPFGVVSDWLRELTGTRAEQPLDHARHLVEDALGWADLPEMREAVERLTELCTGRYGSVFDEGEIEHRKQSILLGLSRLLSRLAAEGPLVIVLDAMQWCDFGTLDLMLALLEQGEGMALFVILVARPDTRILPYIEGRLRLDLAGLSAENQARLLQMRLGVSPGVERVLADIIPRAAGNPYFLLEMVDALLERGVLEIRETSEGNQELERLDLAGSVLALPGTIEQLLADRLTELSDEEQRLIEWIAVMGGPLSANELDQLYGLDAEAVLGQLLARGILEQRGEDFDVRHPLMRDVAYRSISPARRQELHRAIGELLAASNQYRGVLAAVVARHLAKGGLSDQAAELFLEAASVARSSYQMQAAARAYEKVVSILPATDRRLLEAYEALEAMARNEGRRRDRRDYLEKLRALAKHTRSTYWIAVSLLRSSRYELDVGRLAKAARIAELSEQAARVSGTEILMVQALSLAAEVLRDLGDMQGALAAVDRALIVAQHPDVTPRLRAEVLRTRGTLLRRVGRVVEAVEAYAESIAVFQQAGARRMESRAKSSLAFALFALGRYEDGILLSKEAMQIDAATGGRFQTAKTLANLGLCYAGAGAYDKGIECLTLARDEHERVGERDTRADTLLSLSEVLLETGRVEEAVSSVGDAAALIQVTGNRYDAAHERILRALLARSAGKHAEAAERAREARQGAESQAYASFQFYATAIEAVSRVETGELHTGILQATTVLGAIEALQGSEYSLQTRALACEALLKARSPQGPEMRKRSAEYTQARADSLREPALWKAFLERPPVRALLAPVARPDSMLGGLL
jgi:eukaryotic-like serine/threonine-protein kinase